MKVLGSMSKLWMSALCAVFLLASFASVDAQTPAPYVLPYTINTIAGGGMATTVGAACPGAIGTVGNTGSATDTSGNSATTSVTVNLDKTPPTIVAVASPSPNANGWNNSNVTVNFSCGDTLSGVAACSGPVIVSTAGANQLVTGIATDVAGNASTVSTTINLDKTPPVLSITSPTNGATLTSSALTVSGSVSDALSGVAALTCNGAAGTVQSGSFACSLTLTQGANSISVQATDLAGNTATQSESVTFNAGPAIASFSPTSASVGVVITVTGTNFTPNGATPQVTLVQAGGGTLPAPVSSATSTGLSFVIPTGAATGPITVSVNGQSAVSATALTVQSASTFALTVSPSSATLLPGQSTTYQVSLTSTNGFTQLAKLSVSGLPAGVSSSFQPSQITAGGFATLTVTAPASQALGSSQLTITANATAQGSPLSATGNATLIIQAEGGVAFQGRVAVTNPSVDIPLVGVTVRFTGLNYSGNSTGCTTSATTDSGGNFVFASLPPACSGPQLVQYDPSTVIAPSGTYTGLAVSYVLTSGQVTTPGVVVHLPRVDNAETVQVVQSASADQVFAFATVPGVTITVYAGTMLTLPDGSQPNPFPLRVVEIPYDRLPEQVQPDPTQVPVFAMSIEPFNTTASQPISVSYPNRTNLAPGTAMPAFAESAGGLLTDAQIDVLTKNIRSNWSKQGILDTVAAPSYAPKSEGDTQRGEAAYKSYCESCHGPGGGGGRKGSAITNDSFLALISDQGLRTIVIAGRPELGAPDWRGNVPGKPMSDQEVTDVVAWLESRRVENPGQPYSASNYTQHQESEDAKRK